MSARSIRRSCRSCGSLDAADAAREHGRQVVPARAAAQDRLQDLLDTRALIGLLADAHERSNAGLVGGVERERLAVALDGLVELAQVLVVHLTERVEQREARLGLGCQVELPTQVVEQLGPHRLARVQAAQRDQRVHPRRVVVERARVGLDGLARLFEALGQHAAEPQVDVETLARVVDQLAAPPQDLGQRRVVLAATVQVVERAQARRVVVDLSQRRVVGLDGGRRCRPAARRAPSPRDATAPRARANRRSARPCA